MTGSRTAGVVSLGAFILLSHHLGARAWSQRNTPSAAELPAASNAPPSDLIQSSGSLQSIDIDADSLLRVAIPNTLRSRREAMAYTYAVDYRNRNLTPRGKLLADYSAKYEVIFVAGLPYRRQIEENHRSLTGAAEEQETQRYDRAFAERSRMSLDQKRDYLSRRWNVDVPLPQLTTLFANRIVGEEAVNDRQSIVVESLPRADAHPADEEERRALHKRVKLWIDSEDRVVSRVEATLVADDASMKSGTVARIEYTRKDGVWLPAESDVHFQAIAGSDTVSGETKESNSNFRRFHVDVRLLEPARTAAAGANEAQ